MKSRFLISPLFLVFGVAAAGQSWPQWGQNPQHTGTALTAGQSANRLLADIVYDPFVSAEQNESGGDLIVHYQAPLVDGDDVFMSFKGGQYVSCDPPGSGRPFPCGADAWNSQTWGERRMHWEDGALVEKWRFESDWKPEPDAGGLGGWEPVFHAVLAGNFLYVPGAGGSVFKLNRDDGSVVARLSPFASVDPNVFVAGPLAADSAGNIYYNVLMLASSPWSLDATGAWLARIGADDSTAMAAFSDLAAGAPQPSDRCSLSFTNNQLPWPPAPNSTPLTRQCGSQRPGLNIAPAIAPDGTIYTVSRAHFNDRYAYLVAVNPDLTPKWTASLRDRLRDGCGGLLTNDGSPGGCRAGSPDGVDPATNQLPAGRVIDNGSSSPVVAPDGSVFYGAYTRYNYARGHLFKFSSNGDFLASYSFGWDLTPAVFPHDGTYSVIVKDNHYNIGSYCNSDRFCPVPAPGGYFITQLSADLEPEWAFLSSNTQSCQRLANGELSCSSDHPGGFEWCVNAPAVDVNGTVYANSEDGNLYVIGQGGVPLGQFFLNLAIGAAYTPLSVGPDGKIYAENDGHLFVIGN